MNIHQLRFIRSAVRHNFNLSEAAKSLFTSQPGLSKAILNFEDELGVQIFVRQGKRLRGLTEIGVQVVQHIENILTQIEHIKKISADHTTKHEGVLRIATTHTQARYTLPKIIAKFSELYPKVKVSIAQGNPSQIIGLVKDSLADIAIATEIPEDMVDWDISTAFTWQHLLVAPKGHEVFNSQDVTLQQLARYPIITYSKAFSGRKRIDDSFENNEVLPDIILEAVDSDVIKTYVELGMGIGIMAEVAFDKNKDINLDSRKLGNLFGTQSVKIAYRKHVYQRDFTYGFIELFTSK
ncbi:MAG: hypothetical protein RLZZ210_1766 [Pseudomonadota bacterium]|jgi:LysR family cys regulon transcriptional activator